MRDTDGDALTPAVPDTTKAAVTPVVSGGTSDSAEVGDESKDDEGGSKDDEGESKDDERRQEADLTTDESLVVLSKPSLSTFMEQAKDLLVDKTPCL